MIAADGENFDAVVLETLEFARNEREFDGTWVGIVKQVAAVQIKMRAVLDGEINGLFERLAYLAPPRAQLVARHFGVIAVEVVVCGKDDADHRFLLFSPCGFF